MSRNLSNRVEVVTPVTAKAGRERLWEILDVCLKDRRQAWEMDASGGYAQLRPQPGSEGPEALGTQGALIERIQTMAARASMTSSRVGPASIAPREVEEESTASGRAAALTT